MGTASLQNVAMPICSIMNLILVETLKLASRRSVKGVYNTGSGLPTLMDSHPPRFSPGRPHCVFPLRAGLWLDGSLIIPVLNHRHAESCPALTSWH